MKLIMMRPSFFPEFSGGTHLALDLVKDFVNAGWEVEVVVPIGEKFVDLVKEEEDVVKIHRIRSKFVGVNVIKRILRYIDTSWKMYKAAMSIHDADLVMTHSMPPLLGPLGARVARKKRIPVLYWEQDIVSESLISTGIFGASGLKRKLLYKVATFIERMSEKKSTHIITISEQFRDMHIARGLNPNKVSVVYNWIDTQQIVPISPEQNPLFDELGINRDCFTVTYCGNLGVPQNVEVMVDAAEILQYELPVQFVILGGGSREEKVRRYIEEKALKNLKLFPLQPLERADLVYNLGQVGLVIGKAGTSRNGFPSKTWSIMAAGQTMIACFDTDSELCRFVLDGDCGVVVEPDSPEALAQAVRKLYADQDACAQQGRNARTYVVDRFGRMAATEKIIDTAVQLVTEQQKNSNSRR